MCGPGIDRREILAAAHLRNVGEHVQPEGVIAAQERALARTQVVGEPQRDSTLAPGLPRRIRSESRLHAEPRRQADRDEGGERKGRDRAADRLAPAQPLDRPRQSDPDSDGKRGVELERIADRLRRYADPEDLFRDEDRPEQQEPQQHRVGAAWQAFQRKRGDNDDRHECDDRQGDVRGRGVAAAGLRESAHEPEAVPAERKENGKQPKLGEARPFSRDVRRRPVRDRDPEEKDRDPERADEIGQCHGDERGDRDRQPPCGWRPQVAQGRRDAEQREGQ